MIGLSAVTKRFIALFYGYEANAVPTKQLRPAVTVLPNEIQSSDYKQALSSYGCAGVFP